MRTINSLKSFLNDHIAFILAFITVLLLILCPVTIGLILGHYSSNLNRIYENQKAIEHSQRNFQNSLSKQEKLLIDQEIQIKNIRMDLNNFHDRLKDEFNYFSIEEKEVSNDRTN